MPESLLEQAVAAHRSNNLATAEPLYVAALQVQPNRADARYNLAMIYGQHGRAFEAASELFQAVASKPDFGEAWFMLCEFADALGEHELNLLAGQKAVTLMPMMARVWLRYGLALSRVERDNEATAIYRRALELDPALVNAWVNLAFSSKAAGHPHAAKATITKGIEISGQTFSCEEMAEDGYSFLHYHLALLELAQGHYREGFAHFRARFKGGTDWKRFVSAKPQWRGESLRGKTILVMAEQGHGDTLMMARYLPMLKQSGARVVFQVHAALVSYFHGWYGADKIIALDEPMIYDYDYHTMIFDLPYRLGVKFSVMAEANSYLPTPAPDDATDLSYISRKSSEVLAPRKGWQHDRPMVGINWAGQPSHAQDIKRSLPLSAVAELFDQDLSFFNLTRDMRDGEAQELLKYPVINLAGLQSDFAASARLIDQLDLIITCDTATAHLAGGMGKPVWLLLPFAPDWRWGYDSEDSPWYPSMRIFRQMRRGDWASVIARVKEEMDILFGGEETVREVAAS